MQPRPGQQRPPTYGQYAAVPSQHQQPPLQQYAPPLHAPAPQHAQHSTSNSLGAQKIPSFAPLPQSVNAYNPPISTNLSYRPAAAGIPQQLPQQMPYSNNPTVGIMPTQQLQQQQQGVWASDPWQELQGSAAGQLGLQFGSQALKQGHEIMQNNINRWINIPTLKYYFNVNNAYVATKLLLLLFPYRHKSWTRLVKRSEQDGQLEGYKSPREDLNAPDLYIPVMSFVTYILLVGMWAGQQDKFHPEVLGITSTTALFVVVLEVLFVKFGCYLLNVVGDVPWLDLVAYCGYQFVGLIFVEGARLLAPYWVVYAIFAYVMISFGFFMLRSLRYIVQPESTHTVQMDARRRRIQFLFIVVLVQIAMAWLLC
ncbi:hypothetical protein SmJEL517_g04248 [Synchytrium microbalum]|uniref:Protein YIF1 n=1 Tax=Synchytrium microbalum TaxID=1806994 RepID=A0A507BUX1_9FUNG|nr:uncharacterized protein SmJEL517_g04248 [Synchytrium microbalum]TPX32717.1 hypothetical protein SmJEL517_g04248 [Synchytrium microbalum]